jgi:8-oxo-dGTP diphosphatase
MSDFFLEKPSWFSGTLEVSTVFMECDQKILLLQLIKNNKWTAEKWAIPGGKLEKNETPLVGLQREIWEELQLAPKSSELHYKLSLFVKHPIAQYQLHLFCWDLLKFPDITLNPSEHQNFVWQPKSNFAGVPLIEGQEEAYRYVYQRKW